MILCALWACGDGPTVATTPPPAIPLVDPWVDWDLPIGEGRVTWCDADSLSVTYTGDQVATLSSPWRTAVRGAGWEEDLDTSAPRLTSVRYLQEEQALTLSVVVADDTTTVAAALVAAP